MIVRILLVFMTAASTLTVAGAAASACTAPGALCVGLVTDVGTIDDRSFNQSAWEGVLQAQAELGAHVKAIETRDAFRSIMWSALESITR